MIMPLYFNLCDSKTHYTFLFFISSFSINSVWANKCPTSILYCSSSYTQQRQAIEQQFNDTQLTTNASSYLLKNTQNLWLNQVFLCKKKSCINKLIDIRHEELLNYSTLNQTLTQHFFKYTQGVLSEPVTAIEIHQLDQKRLKIEGLIKGKNNQLLTAYTDSNTQIHLINTENNCAYHFNVQKSLLQVSSVDHKCQPFVGIYRLYD